MPELILFSISTLPVLLLGMYIYKKDKNKEPIKLLVKLFVCGILSCLLTVLISFILGIFFPIFSEDSSNLNFIELIFYAFIVVALIEEFSKWIFSYKIAYNDKHFEEIYDMIVYSVFVALGFAFFENLIYVYGNGIITGLIRAISAVPGHVCDGVFMGYYLGLAKQSQLNKRNDLKNKNIIYSLVIPTFLHGVYDFCLFVENILFLLLFLIFVILIYIFAIKKIKKLSSINKKMRYVDNYCPNCGTKVESNYCPKCGRKNY